MQNFWASRPTKCISFTIIYIRIGELIINTHLSYTIRLLVQLLKPNRHVNVTFFLGHPADNYGVAAMSCQKQLKVVVERKGDSKICKETGNDHQRQNLSFWKRYYGLVVLKYFTISLSVLPT